MDIFGHAFSGLLIGTLLEPGPLLRDPSPPRTSWAWMGALAATFPDVDAVSYLWGPEAFARHHQIYTHTILAFLALPPLLALLVRRLGFAGSPARTALLFYAGMAAHLLGDVIATWPLRFLLPFSDRGFAFAFIHRDFSLGLALLLGVFAATCRWDGALPARRALALAGLVAGVALVLSGYG